MTSQLNVVLYNIIRYERTNFQNPPLLQTGVGKTVLPRHGERRNGCGKPAQPDAAQQGTAGRTAAGPLQDLRQGIHTQAGGHHRELSGRTVTGVGSR